MILKGMINLSKIPKERIWTSPKTGDKYIPVTLFTNDTEDQFGKMGSIQVQGAKLENGEYEKGTYIANLERAGRKAAPQDTQPLNTQETLVNPKSDDLPF